MSQTPSNIISPCSHLNDDVLREIFIHCTLHIIHRNISTCFIVGGDYKVSIRGHPQLSLSHVCSSWRDITLLTPQLWDNICITGLTEATLSIAKEYLSRAQNLPVSIAIKHSTGLPGEDWRSQLTNFLSSYRIRTLGLDASEKMPRFDFHPVLHDLPQQSVAELETLRIFSRREREKAQLDLNDTRYPKLAVLYTKGAYKISSFNSHSLRRVNCKSHSMTVIESWDFLTHCPSLEESQLSIMPVNANQRPIPMPQIHLQRLRVLALYSRFTSRATPFSTFIEVLSVPVLEILMLLGPARVGPETAFQSLAHRSNYFPHLRRFYLEYSTSIIDAGILLASMPCLKCITLRSDTATNKFIFDDLTLTGLASGSLTPQLQTVEVGPILNTGSFLDMVESRMKNAQISGNGVPALFTSVEIAGFGANYSSRCLDMRQRGIPVSLLR